MSSAGHAAQGPATRKELRNTGLVVGIAFCVLGLAQLIFHGKIPPHWCFMAGGILIFLGLVAPPLLRPFHWAWMKFSLILGWVMNRVILGIIFYIFFTLTALVLKLIRRDALHLNFQKKADTYWIPKSQDPVPPERYERQF